MNPPRWGIVAAAILLSLAALAIIALPIGFASVVMMMSAGNEQLLLQSCAQGDFPTDSGDEAEADWQAPDIGNITLAQVSKSQIEVAKQGWLTAQKLKFGDRGATIFIATAMQESTLGANPTIARPNGDGDVGVLQQRAKVGWYGGQPTMAANVAWLNNPANAATVFFQGRTITAKETRWAKKAGTRPSGPTGYHIPGLAQIKGWRDLPITVAAQRVQRSAYPDAYARHQTLATKLVAQFRAQAGTAYNTSTATTGSDQEPAFSADCAPNDAATTALTCPASGLAAEKGMTPDGKLLMRCLHQSFPAITSLLGIGDRPANVDDDHQTGRAVDAMTGTNDALGDKVAAWAKTNAAKLGVKYIIWDAHIWSTERSKEGWRACGSPSASCYAGPNKTQAHRDHVHISVHGNSALKADTATSIKGKATTPIARGSYTVGARWGATGSWSRYHTGQDIAAPIGTPIRAAAAGVVEPARGGSWAGVHVVIRHNDGSRTLYAHLQHADVSSGQKVKTGQRIGNVGMTGRTFGPHLHFEHYPKGTGRIGNPYTTDNPATWLAKQGASL